MLLSMAVLGAAGLLAGAACLPDLAAFQDPPEAGEPLPSTPPSFCGDGVIETLEDGGGTEECDPGDAATSTAGCEDCRLTCVGTLDRATGHCYFFADPAASYGEALEACRGARAHVVTIGSDDEAKLVRDRVEPDGGAYWLGLSVQPNLNEQYGTPLGVDEPGWPSAGTGCSGCYALADDAGLFPADPDAGPNPLCLVGGGPTWVRSECSGVARRTLCEREPLGSRLESCGGALCTTFVRPDAGAKRYVVWPSAVTADEAAKTCTSTGGSLVMFDTREEREAIARELDQRLASSTLQTGIWIGLSRSGDAWTWDDDAGDRPSPWGDHEPRGPGRAFIVIDEANYDTQLARTDEGAPPDQKRAFICQRRVP